MASISAAAKFALAVAVGCACILSPILDGRAVLDAAVAIVLITLPITFFLGVILVFVHVTRRRSWPRAPPGGSLSRRTPWPPPCSPLSPCLSSRSCSSAPAVGSYDRQPTQGYPRG
ncbi:unnamed protein product [Urochloa humidicola]